MSLLHGVVFVWAVWASNPSCRIVFGHHEANGVYQSFETLDIPPDLLRILANPGDEMIWYLVTSTSRHLQDDLVQHRRS